MSDILVWSIEYNPTLLLGSHADVQKSKWGHLNQVIGKMQLLVMGKHCKVLLNSRMLFT